LARSGAEVVVMTIYAFDVDETLEISEGPVLIAALRELVAQGHVVGLCGNYAKAVHTIPDWPRIMSFLGPMGMTKAEFLAQLRTYISPDVVMVGNIPGVSGSSEDSTAAEIAEVRFIQEHAFAEGAR